MSDLESQSLFVEHVVEHRGSNFVYTDGSKSDAGVGFGVHSNDFNRSGALPPVASIFTAEVYAILTAVEKIVLEKEGSFTIFSDARSVLQALEVFNSSNPLVLKILKWLSIIELRGLRVQFCWVPAHVGVCGNEKADSLAKNAASELLPRRYPIPYTDFLPNIKKLLCNKW
ncbi:uncharacterized protein [Palaemon carinicauda]|uniref:uncharacterized protein n=1 Tax=Palaemon carinicauda TaxID=392227 RepID=UPI0035B60181